MHGVGGDGGLDALVDRLPGTGGAAAVLHRVVPDDAIRSSHQSRFCNRSKPSRMKTSAQLVCQPMRSLYGFLGLDSSIASILVDFERDSGL